MTTSRMILCPACESPDSYDWTKVTNVFGHYQVRKCRSCRSAFIWPRPEIEDIEDFYRDSGYKKISIDEFKAAEQDYLPTASEDAIRLISYCQRIAKGKAFLDIGAGAGEFSRAASALGFAVTACEPNANSRMIFREINGFEPIPVMFDSIFASSYQSRYDVALMSQVLEHIENPLAFVKNLYTVLQPDGIAIVAVPHFGSFISRLQGKRDMFLCPPEHLNFFSIVGLQRLFEKNGFSLIAMETVTKLNRAKMCRQLHGGTFAEWSCKGAYQAMRVIDRFRLGTVLNAFWRKETGVQNKGVQRDLSSIIEP
jgi:2-polyprenyl-3-methyl-5-hydroxy-6-metoxy-1,4-benzoquinol methylase